MRMSFCLISCLLLAICHTQANALGQVPNFDENWHQWRGAKADGAAQGNPPTTWSEASNIKWKRKIPGEGTSTPIVWDGKVFVLSAVLTDRVADDPPMQDSRSLTKPPANYYQFTVWCLDLETGNPLWNVVAIETVPHEGRHPTHTYAAASPMTDGKRLVVSFGSRGVFCYTLDGQLQWQRDFGDMRTRNGWGEAASPVIASDKVIVNWDQEEQSMIYAVSAATGETIWERTRDEPTTWATPLIVEQGGVTQVITNGTNAVRSYDLDSGELVWQSQGTTLNAIPSPVVVADQAICMSGYRGNLAISVQLGTRGEATGSFVDWKIARNTPYVPSPLLSGDRLYFTRANQAVISCVSARTGEPIFGPTRIPGLENLYASPVATSGRIYLPSREGMTAVFRDADQFELLATNQLDDGIDASPAVVGNKLLLRGRKFLYCIEETQ